MVSMSTYRILRAARRTALALSLAGLSAGLGPLPAMAQSEDETYCSKPVIPFCAKSEATFEDSTATESCREEVSEFVQEMRGYADCLTAQQNEARERAKAVEDLFACMAAGKNDCEAGLE